MNDLNFRTWHSNWNRFLYFQGINLWNDVKSTYKLISDPKENYSYYCYDPDNCIVQVSTGLKDKKGKEIFVGDILSLSDYYIEKVTDFGEGPEIDFNHLAEVIYIQDCAAFGVRIKESGCCLAKGEFAFVGIMIDMGSEYITNECEVVGNILENKDLLKNE